MNASVPQAHAAPPPQGTPAAAPRAITIAILAMGGEGGGVLADWLVDLAEHNGFLAQATSVPGVAQRTGATTYYLEMFRRADVPAGASPVMALSPVPGEVDVVIASELMEAGRALQKGLVSDDRTTLVASTHRVYSMTERTAMGDARVDAAALLDGSRAAARRLVAADFGRIADDAGSPISPALYGALAATGALPFTREQFEDTIRRGGVGVKPSLVAFAAGFEAAGAGPGGLVETQARRPASGAGAHPAGGAGVAAVGPRLAQADARIASEFPAACHAVLRAGILRCADYQDVAYADDYLECLASLRAALASGQAASLPVLVETARHLALWMTYEDAARVADLKTRRARFERVSAEVRLAPAQQLDINEYMHPRLEELADSLPASIGRWLLRSRLARACVRPFMRKGRVVRTSSLRGYLLLYTVAGLRGIRRRSLRYQVEHGRIRQWLDAIERLAPARPELALEVARAQRLVKGYGDTHARGWGNFERILARLPALEAAPDGAERLRTLVAAALADDSGRALEEQLAAA